MPALIGPLLGFLVGLALAWGSTDALSRLQGTPARERALALSAQFGLLVHAPMAGYFLATAPDWALCYWVDSQQLPRAFDIALVILDAAAPPLGFAIATRPGSTSPRALARAGIIPLVLAAALLALSLPRLGVSATFRQFHSQFGIHAIAGSSLGYSLMYMWAVWTVGLWWTARSLRRLEPSPSEPVGSRY